ncbi:uncharacterized protein LOC110774437 [Prunus avium]|uniref:Uncharacterized protein LOC110774437 n=1 Tax=Prunus avium TaxID=42229 RepID=A0A6P5U5P0_PRUAV|nr:uncharacterized protein LOC110774437 [Prunus avium]
MSIPHYLWGHAVLSAAYLINRSRVLDFKTPHDVFGDHVSPVSVSKLPPKVFGCVAYVHVYSHQRSKLDPCALRCVFIGYSSTHKGYKCYHPPTQKVHVTLDVTFHEEVPYYVSPSSPIQGERGSELKSFGVKNMEDVGPEEGISEEHEEGFFEEQEATGRMEEATGRERICLDTTGRIERQIMELLDLEQGILSVAECIERPKTYEETIVVVSTLERDEANHKRKLEALESTSWTKKIEEKKKVKEAKEKRKKKIGTHHLLSLWEHWTSSTFVSI